ncbi:MAG TPA: hypothetical protein DIV40_02840 [Clostridiales bacterium]|jgi:beta-lactamase regulating signal transducer with metallopeptidase domain|nr:hypothetical protein [Clostridiales bacterium]
MSRLFLVVLNMSITGGFVALAVMIARFLLKRAPKIFSYALWAIVLFRLICPFSFESAVSLIPANRAPIPKEAIYMQNPAINTGIKMIDIPVNNTLVESLPQVNQAAGVNPVRDTIVIYAIIWLFGITVLLCYGFITYFRLKQRLSTATLVRDNIYETDLIKTAFVMGFIEPKIIIPIDLPKNEFDYIIKHEETHIKRFDYIIKPVAFMALIIHWYNPIIWLSYYMMAKDMEMSCDESVMKNTKEDIRVNYSSSLLALSAKQSGLLSPLAFGEGNVKSRIKNVLNYKKPSFWIMILAVIIIAFVLISFGTDPQKIIEQSEPVNNQNQDIDSEINADNNIYKNESLGFSLNFPKEWKDKYEIEESDNYISVFDKQIYDTGQGGLLFTINRTIGEMITQQDMNMEPVPTKIILQGNGYTYFYRLPSDVNYPVNDEELSKHYQEMSEQINYVVQGISLLGEQKPEASNDGFKVMGSSYFTVEIPSEWDIKPLEYLPIWDIYEGDNPVGWIQMLPYETEEIINVSDNAIREYLYNEDTLRKMNITLRSNYADKSIMDKIKMSFKFTGGPYNVIDLESTANLYIAQGYKKVFGMIDSFEIENENPTAVIVNVMEFIPDGPNDNNPNGYRIEDLKYKETYTLEHGVNVAALAPPNYTSYEMYYMPLLDENFINNYDYKYFYFDFIVGSDGNLLVVLGHYIP